MAVALFCHYLDQTQTADLWRLESAGTWAREGEPAMEKVQKVLTERGLNADGHLSRSVSGELLELFNLILTFEAGHKEALQVEFFEIRDRVYLLSEMIGHVYDVRDPVGGPLSGFRYTASEINSLIVEGFEKILLLAQDRPAIHP